MAWFWFVIAVLIFILAVNGELSIEKRLEMMRSIMEDKTNTSEGKIASMKIILDNLLKGK